MAKKKAVNNKKTVVSKKITPDKKSEVEARKKLKAENKLKIFNYLKVNKSKWLAHKDFIDIVDLSTIRIRPLLVDLMNEGKAERKTDKNRRNYYKFKSN